MRLSDVKTIWGIPISSIKERAKAYKRWVILMYLFDALIITIATVLLFQNGMGFEWYAIIVVIFAIFCNIIINSVSNISKYEAFKFYRQNNKYNIKEKQYNITNEQLYSILYCAGYKRLKVNRTFLEYCDSICALCCEDKYNAKKIMKYLSKYEVSDDSSDNITLKCLVLKRGGKEHLVDITFCIEGDTDLVEEKESIKDAGN